MVSWSVSLLALVVLVAALSVGLSHSTSRADSLVLHGHAPRTAELGFDVATSGSLRTTGTLWLDLATSRVRATMMVPVLTAATEIDVREVGDRLYLTSPNLADATGPVWYVQPVRWPSLRGLAAVLLRPNVALLSLLANARVVRQGSSPTYELIRRNVSLGSFSPSVSTSTLPGTLALRVTTGRQGEFSALWARLTSARSTTTVSLRVLSYHPRVSFAAPPLARATTPAGPLLRQLVTSGALGSLVLPTQLLQLFSHPKVG